MEDVATEPPDGPGAEAPPPLASRVAQSTTIVTGRIVDVTGGQASISVAEVLKGEAVIGDVVVVSGETPPAVGPLAVGDTGVWLISGMGNPPGLLGGGSVGVSEAQVRAMLRGG
jgi:hypothetical protein